MKAYILNVENALNNIDTSILPDEARRLVEIARSYLSDSKYYLEKGDYFTALACIAYAEGLIDSLNHMGIIKIGWKPLTTLLKRPKILVAGSFEIIHPGHIYLLRKAWEKGEVYVIVSRDKNFARFKGREPAVPEDQRRAVVESIKYVSKAVLGDQEDFLKPVLDIKPDMILLGPDQSFEPNVLEKMLAERGLSVRVEKLEKRLDDGLYSVTGIVKRILEIHGCGSG